jgi:chaperonin cofactor prefoldin
MGVEEIRVLLDEKVNDDPPIYRFGNFGRLLVKELMQAYDGLKAQNESLRSQLHAAEGEERVLRDEVQRLRLMEARVKDGKLTEEEFQAICHDLSPDDEERFMRGCHAMWQRLFKRVETRRVAEILGIKAEDVLGG